MSKSVNESLPDALAGFTADGTNSGTPCAYIRAIRTGSPGTRHPVTVDGVDAHITIAGTRPPDAGACRPAREAASFCELRAVVAAAECDGIQPALPPEIGMVTWQHDGHERRVCQPGTAPAMRRARLHLRRRLTALSPLPALIGALIQPLAGSATAVGIAIAPIPPMHPPGTPPPPVVREMTGDIARPQLPYTPATFTVPAVQEVTAPTLPAFPAADAASPGRDTFTDPRPTTPSPSTTDAPTPAPTVTVTVDGVTGSSPSTDPNATTGASPSPAGTPLRRLLHPRHRHPQSHRRHLLDGLLRHR